MSNFLDSKKVRVVLIILGSLIGILLVFGVGITVGYDRANYVSQFAQNYSRNFNPGMNPAPIGEHGTAGMVIDVSSSTLSVQDQDDDERSVVVLPYTIIREVNNTIQITAINVGDQVVVIGEPNPQGQVAARFIRVFTGSSSAPINQGQ